MMRRVIDDHWTEIRRVMDGYCAVIRRVIDGCGVAKRRVINKQCVLMFCVNIIIGRIKHLIITRYVMK